MRKNAAGITANMAVGGILTDHNLTPDSACTGLSNPYNGTITLYRSVLPVTLLDFYGTYRDKMVTLSWSTEREISTKYFTVERSSDQLSFRPLVNITASENGQNKKDYRYTDNASLNGINYYRLKMVDTDGKFTYSKTLPVVVPLGNAMVVFPNPVKDKLFIRLPGVPAETEITVADAGGTCIKKLRLKAGTSEASMNTTALPAGVYSISLQCGQLKSTLQFIKQ